MSIVNDNMSDTPETDAQGWGDGRHPWVATDFARKLERKRDEVTKDYEFCRELYKVQEQCLETARRELDEARELHGKALSEREATEKEVDAMLERLLKAERERNEAREALVAKALEAKETAKAAVKPTKPDECGIAELQALRRRAYPAEDDIPF
jgi:hypothetical protein